MRFKSMGGMIILFVCGNICIIKFRMFESCQQMDRSMEAITIPFWTFYISSITWDWYALISWSFNREKGVLRYVILSNPLSYIPQYSYKDEQFSIFSLEICQKMASYQGTLWQGVEHVTMHMGKELSSGFYFFLKIVEIIYLWLYKLSIMTCKNNRYMY